MKIFSTTCVSLSALLLVILFPPLVRADAVTLILRNAEVITMQPEQPVAQAVAIAGQRIAAVGSNKDIEALADKNTRVVDVGGRTIIPGLIDTHIHAVRGGQTFGFETYWHGITSLEDALAALQTDAAKREQGQWVVVAGSWHPNQFREKRPPSVADLDAALPDHPAYVQYLYDYALLNSRGIATLRLNEADVALPPGMSIERDAQGRATGKLIGGISSFNALLARLPQASAATKKENLRRFFTELNARGVTGIIDPSAGSASAYEPLFSLHTEERLTIRVGYRISAEQPGTEAEWFRAVMAFRPSRHDDGMLAFLGLGESLVFGMNDGGRIEPGFSPPQSARAELASVATFAAERRIALEIHASTDDAAKAVLDVFEQVAKDHPLGDLRWAIAHLNTGSPQTLDRMKKLGLAYTVQMGPFFEAPAIKEANGPEAAALSPPLRLALEKGLMVAGGTDSTRVGIFGAWQAIEYHISGASLGGVVTKPESALLSRHDALKLYTANAAWLAFAEKDRGSLAPGKLADLAVLDAPYLTMPTDKIHTIRSVFTLLGGVAVHDQLPQGPVQP